APTTEHIVDLMRRLWGVSRDALDTVILFHEAESLHFEFTTASDFPEPIYRELGRMFPELAFDIAAVDPAAGWAATGRIVGENANFDENADCRKVYERIYKEPVAKGLHANI